MPERARSARRTSFKRTMPPTCEENHVTLMCTRLQDETGAGFLVISLTSDWLATPEAATQTIRALRSFKFPYVCAIRRAGRWIYVGKDSLTAICESRLGQNPEGGRLLFRQGSEWQPAAGGAEPLAPVFFLTASRAREQSPTPC